MRFLTLSILLLNFLLFSCDLSSEKASNNNNRQEGQVAQNNAITEEKTELNRVSTDVKEENTTDNDPNQNQKYSEGLKEKLVGQTCSYFHGLVEQEGYYIVTGGVSFGTGYGEEKIINDKLFSIAIVRGKIGDNKEYTTHSILKQSYEDESIPCKIVDVLDVEAETDLFEKYSNENIGICPDVLFNGEIAPELFALVEYEEDVEFYKSIFKVWRVNRKTEKFEEVKDFTGITVINEDF